jgi:hypothetical protein
MARDPRRRCRNCPEDKQGLPPPEPPKPKTATYEGESEKLWHQALYSCGNLVELLFGYVAMDVPGDPLPAMKRLHARLGEIIQTREERTSETFRPAQ